MAFSFIIGASQQKRSFRPLYMKWRTTNPNETVTLPLPNVVGVNYNFIIDWGDGQVSQITAYNDSDRIHTYAIAGDYISRISGTCEGWSFNNAGDKAKLIEVYGGKGHVFKYLYGGFNGCTKLTTFNCPDLNTTSCTSLYDTFRNCSSLTVLNVFNWDVSNVNSLSNTFSSLSSLTSIDVSGWDTSSCTNMGSTFNFCSKLTSLDLSSWNTSKVITFNSIFADCSGLTSISIGSSFVKSTCTDIRAMFTRCSKLTSIDTSAWNTSNVQYAGITNDYRGVFASCTALTSLDVSSWDTSKVTTFDFFCIFCSNLTTVTGATNLVKSACTTIGGMFLSCTKLTTIDVSGWDVSKVQYFGVGVYGNGGAFMRCYALTSLDVSGWDTSSGIRFSGLFQDCLLVPTLDVSGWNVSNATNMSGVFASCNTITTLDFSGWDTAKVTTFNRFLSNCYNLATVYGISAVSSGDLFAVSSDCTDIRDMFHRCYALTGVDVSGWDVSNVLYMGSGEDYAGVFSYCTTLTSLDLTGWDTSKVINFNSFCRNSTALTSISGVTNLVTSACTTMAGMFTNCNALTSIDVSGWNTSKVTNFQQLLDGCTGLTTCDVSVLSTAAATNVSYMFRYCRSMTSIDISGWDLSLVTAANMTQYMFYGCYGLTSLTLPSSLSRVDNQFAVFGGSPPDISVYNINRSAAPIVSGTPFGNYAKPLHVPVSNSGYNVAPWTNTAIFSSIINDL